MDTRMTAFGVAFIAGSALLAGCVAALRRHMFLRPLRPDRDALSLTFQTSTARARQGWAAFWARDPFVQAQRNRTGMAFGTYAVPGGNPITTHLAPNDLVQHTLVLGATGSGKSSLLEHLARYHFREERGFALIDLHGDLYTRVAAWAVAAQPPRLVLIDFTQPETLPGWNLLTRLAGVDIGRQVDLLVGVLKRLYAGEDVASWSWGVKVEEITRYALRACIESAEPITLVELRSFFLMPAVRQRVLATASAEVRGYFSSRFGAREEMYVSAVLNKLEPFLGSTAVQRFLGQPESTIDLLGVINRGDIVLVNLAKGYLGPTAEVMGRLLVNALQTAALRRERIPPHKRRPYSILLDEAHVLAAAESGLEDFLVAARKYRVFVTLAAQGLSLFPPNFRPHLLGNTGRQFFFRLPHSEARALSRDIFEPLGTIWRQQIRPNETIDEPLLTATEEIAWRTAELANLSTGACYWFLKGRPYKARRIQVLAPPPLPARSDVFGRSPLSTTDGAGETPLSMEDRWKAAVEARSARRVRAAGIEKTNPTQ
jgi:energy-coupling factor transporter ATP-binding protein EcfA2